MIVDEERQMGRAKNAALSFFERKLSVPKIYIDADWAGHHIAVLAIDRDGVGDVHAILLFRRHYFDDGSVSQRQYADMIGLITEFAAVPAQFKYIAAVDIVENRQDSAPLPLSSSLLEKSLAADGLGRIGFIRIEVPREGDPQTDIVVKPERFRAKIAELADQYVQEHTADWEIRA